MKENEWKKCHQRNSELGLNFLFSSNSWFSVHNRKSSVWSSRLCVVAWASCDWRRLSCWSNLFKLPPVTRSRVQVICIWIKNAAHNPRFHWNSREKRQMEKSRKIVEKLYFPPSKAPTWTSPSKLIFRLNFTQTCFKNYDSLIVKITKLFALPKFGSLKCSTSAYEDWRNFSNPQNLASF